MTNPSLVILAAGMGSRYGGLKQLDQLGPSGETIIDYSLYDALEAGFKKIALASNLPISKQLFFQIFLLSEKILLRSNNLVFRKKIARLLQKLRLFSGDIFLKIQK